MPAACLLLAIAVLSGTLLSFLYDREAPLLARLSMGSATGLALLATIGFLLALWLGLTVSSITLGAAAMLSPCLLLFGQVFRAALRHSLEMAKESAASAFKNRKSRAVASVLLYLGLTILLGLVFARAAYATPEGIFTGDRHDLGDLTLHMQVISSFAQGQNFPPQDPTFAGVRFAYPFLVDFLTAMLIRAGAGLLAAMWLQSMVLAAALMGMVYHWAALLTRDRLAALLSPLLVIFSGGLGWAWILQDVHESNSGLIPLLGNLPHDYTIMDVGGILRWGNSLATLIVPQRSILFGLPLALVIFCQWWRAVDSAQGRPSSDGRGMLAAGLFAGLLPLIHAHTFLVVMGTGACLAVIFRQSIRAWLLFLAAALLIASPQLLWLAGNGGVKMRSYLGWQPGWDHGSFNPVLFWLANTGLFIPLLLVAVLGKIPGLEIPKKLLWFYAPFALCFVIPNLIKLAPWIWDNIKVLFYWYVGSVPFVALLLARGLRQGRRWRWLSAAALASLLLAGALDIWRIADGQTEYREFPPEGLAIAHDILDKVPPGAVVLHAPTYNSPVFLTGRRSLLGYPGWTWSRGLDDAQRQADIKEMYAGSANADDLLDRYRVRYVLVGPEELATLKVNETFWSRYPQVAREGSYRLYRTAGLELRIEK
jgi:hypothetical protein